MVYTDDQLTRIKGVIAVLESIVHDNEEKIEFLESRNEDLSLEISCLRRCLDEQSCV